MEMTAYNATEARTLFPVAINKKTLNLIGIILCVSFFMLTTFDTKAGEMECARFKNWLSDNYAGVGQQGSSNIDSHMASSNIEHRFVWENDVFSNSGDKYYTNGMKLSWLHNPCRRIWWDKFSSGYRNIANYLLKPDASSVIIGTGGVFGMNMYTPEIIDPAKQRSSDPVVRREVEDRPYAGWLYAGISYSAYVEPEAGPQNNSAFTIGTKVIMTEIQFGVIGPAAGQEYAQTWIHKDLHLSSRIPQGWEYQVPNQFGFNMLSAFQENIFTLNQYVRITPIMGFSLGNVMNFVNAGGVIAVGIPGLGKPDDSFVYTTIQPALRKLSFISDKNDKRLSLQDQSANHAAILLGLDARYIHDSIFIEGSGDARHNIELTHFVYDFIYGITYEFKKYEFAISYKRVWRSSEFSHSDGTDADPHTFGQVGVEWYF